MIVLVMAMARQRQNIIIIIRRVSVNEEQRVQSVSVMSNT